MTRRIAALFTLLFVLVAAETGAHAIGVTSPRLDQVQALGTHNSYHQRPTWPLWLLIPDWDYAHSPLAVQLGDEGVRQVELDVHWDAAAGRYDTFHLELIDQNSSCRPFTECLRQLKAWSDAHPSHLPVMVLIEPKDELNPAVHDHYDTLDADIRNVMGTSLLTPDAVRGGHASVREAVETGGWPRLDAARGSFVFALLDSGTGRSAYLAGHPGLEGRAMFVNSVAGAPHAAVFLRDNPVADSAEISQLVAAHYLVRTRADSADELQAALASGAQFISSDEPGPGRRADGFVARIPDGTPARCNPVSAPAGCVAADVESGNWSPARQHISVDVDGVTTTGDVAGTPIAFGPAGSAAVPFIKGSAAGLQVDLTQFAGLPAYVGTVRTASGAEALAIFAPVDRVGRNGVGARLTWFGRTITWRVDTY